MVGATNTETRMHTQTDAQTPRSAPHAPLRSITEFRFTHDFSRNLDRNVNKRFGRFRNTGYVGAQRVEYRSIQVDHVGTFLVVAFEFKAAKADGVKRSTGLVNCNINDLPGKKQSDS
jgi:hypothetical protein